MEKNDENREIISESIQTFFQILISAGSAALAGSDPFAAGGGTMLSQFFGLRRKLKVNRVEKFIYEFGNYINSIAPNVDSKNINSEDFGDFFEALLIKVSETNSSKKLNSFKNLAVNQILHPINFDISIKYLELLDKLIDNQIIILNHWMTVEKDYWNLSHEKFKLNKQLSGKVKYNNQGSPSKLDEIAVKRKIEIIKNKMKDIESERVILIDSFQEGEFDFLVNELRSLGLLDLKSAGNVILGVNAFRKYQVSEFGQKLYQFTMNYDS